MAQQNQYDPNTGRMYANSDQSNQIVDSSGNVNWGGMVNTGANIWGSQNAAEAATHGNEAGIGTQTGAMGNIRDIYGTQSRVGNQAIDTLGRLTGGGGQPADYSNFLNMPGYQFAVSQGEQAINRNAAASGGAYTPNTMATMGNFVTGTAMGDYNTYVNQLLGIAGFGENANQNVSGAQLRTSGNISQLQGNIGQNQAGGYAGTAGAIGGAAGGSNSSGYGSLVNSGLNYIGNHWGSGNASGVTDPNNSGDMSNGTYNGGAFGGGAPLYDPSTGGYPTGGGDNSGGGGPG